MGKKNQQPVKQWINFYNDFKSEVERILGMPYRDYWEKRNMEIYVHARPRLFSLTRVDLEILMEVLNKAQGKTHKKYYKRSWKGPRDFVNLMEVAIENKEKGEQSC